MTATAALTFASRLSCAYNNRETWHMGIKPGTVRILTCIWRIHVSIQHCNPHLVLAFFSPLNHKCDITGFTSAGVDGSHDSVKGLAISIDQNLGSPVVLLSPGPTSSPCCFCIYLQTANHNCAQQDGALANCSCLLSMACRPLHAMQMTLTV